MIVEVYSQNVCLVRHLLEIFVKMLNKIHGIEPRALVLHFLTCMLLKDVYQLHTLKFNYSYKANSKQIFLSFRFPLRALSICSATRARWASIGCFVVFIIYTMPYYLFSNKVNKIYCVALNTKGLLVTVYSYVNLAISSLIPFTIILILNALIISTVRKRFIYFNKDVNSQNDKTDQNIPKKTRESQLVVMLLLVTFALLALTLPQYIRYVVYLIVNNRSSAKEYATCILLYNITQKLYFT